MNAPTRFVLIPARVTACALDPAQRHLTGLYTRGTSTEQRQRPNDWAWEQPNYAPLASGDAPLEALWKNLHTSELPPPLKLKEQGSAGPAEGSAGPAEGSAGPSVALSWAALSGLGHPLDSARPDSLPALPDRWLVMRIARPIHLNTAAKTELPRWSWSRKAPAPHCWIIDTGVTSGDETSAPVLVKRGATSFERVGCKRTLDQAKEKLPTELRQILSVRGAVGSPDATFAAFAPSSLNNLGFIDKLDDPIFDDVPLEDCALSYFVAGWYRQPELHDPVARMRAEGRSDLEIRRTLGLFGLDELAELLRQGRSEKEIREVLGVPEVEPERKEAFFREEIARVRAREKTRPNDPPADEANIRNALSLGWLLPPLGDRVLVHGMVAYIDYWNPKSYLGPAFGAPVPGSLPANPAQGTFKAEPLRIGFGETAEEALAELAAERDDTKTPQEGEAAERLARLLRTLLAGQAEQLGTIGDAERIELGERRHRFQALPGGTEWTIAVERPDEQAAVAPGVPAKPGASSGVPLRPTASQRADLAAINAAQAEADARVGDIGSLAETTYAAWWMRRHQAAIEGKRSALEKLLETNVATLGTLGGQRKIAADRAAELCGLLQREFNTDFDARKRALEAAIADAQKALAAEKDAARKRVLSERLGVLTAALPRLEKLVLRAAEVPPFFAPREPAVALKGIGARMPPRAPSFLGRDLGAVASDAAPSLTGAGPAYERLEPVIVPKELEDYFPDVGKALAALAAEAALAEEAVAAVVRAESQGVIAFDEKSHVNTWRQRSEAVYSRLDGAAIRPEGPQHVGFTRPTLQLPTADKRQVALAELCTAWTQQPWMPVFLDWKVTWSGRQTFPLMGRTLLSHRPQNLIGGRLHTARKRAAAELIALEQGLMKVVGWDVIAQTLSGLHQQLITRDDAFAKIAPGPDDPHVGACHALLGATSLGPPSPLSRAIEVRREGTLRLDSIRVVDHFGQVLALSEVPVSAAGKRGAQEVALQPRLLEPSRLAVRFARTAPMNATKEQAEAVVRKSPVLGWIVPSLLDRALIVYDGDGQALGMLDRRSAGVRWRPVTPSATLPEETPDLNGVTDPDLKALLAGLIAQSERFQALLEQIDAGLRRTLPAGALAVSSPAAILGRPLALVHTQVQVERRGGPMVDRAWLSDVSSTKAAEADFARVVNATRTNAKVKAHLTVTTGLRSVPDDGVIGWWDGPLDRPIRATRKLATDIAPVLQIAVPVAAPTPPTPLVLLLDPTGSVCFDAPELPATTARMPGSLFEEALGRLAAVLSVEPLLVPSRAALDAMLARPDPEGGRPHVPLPLPVGRQGVAAGARAAVLSIDRIDIPVDAISPTAAVTATEVAAVDGLLLL